ncbi:unnamed protein product, partial [Polarella glacialis]
QQQQQQQRAQGRPASAAAVDPSSRVLEGGPPDAASYNGALCACARASHWDVALLLLAKSAGGGAGYQQGLKSDAALLGAAIGACERGRRWAEALALLGPRRFGQGRQAEY